MRIIRVIDFLRHKASISGANFVASEEDLRTLEPTSSTWVYGPRTLVDQVLGRTDIHDLHIFELVRSDTGHWMIPAHAGSLPLRYLNRSVLGRVVEIGISPPPTSFVLEHEGWRLLNSALVRFQIAPLDVHNGFLQVQMDNLCVSVLDSEIEDLDSGTAFPSEPEIVVEGPRDVLKERIKQQASSQGKGIYKRSQRKSTAVADGLQLRLSGSNDAIENIRSNDTVSSVVGASFSAGVTVYVEGDLWSELFSCLAGSIYSTQVVHESPKWITIGCGSEDLEQVLLDLRGWRESSAISNDFHYRRWEVECPAGQEHDAVLLHVGNGTIYASSHRAVAYNVAGRISIPAIKQYLKHRNITADIAISDHQGASCVELYGEVQILQGTSVGWKWQGTTYALTFEPADSQSGVSAVTTSAHTQLDPSPIETDPDAGQVRTESGQINAPESVDNHHTLYHVGDVVRVPLMPRGDSVKTDPGLPLDPVHEPTAAVKLLEVHQDKALGAVWTGIRVQDELAVEGFQPIQPKEVHKGRYLQLTHALAPDVRLHSNKRSKHYPLPKPGTKARTSIEQQVAKDATSWTEAIRKHIKEKSIVYLIDASSNRDDLPTPSTSNTSTTSPPSSTSNQHGHLGNTQAERTMWAAPRKDVTIKGVYTCMSPPRDAALQARFGDRDIFNLSVAVRATDADVLAAKLTGGRTGEQEARARLNTSTSTTANTDANQATRKRGPTDAVDPQDQPIAGCTKHAK